MGSGCAGGGGRRCQQGLEDVDAPQVCCPVSWQDACSDLRVSTQSGGWVGLLNSENSGFRIRKVTLLSIQNPRRCLDRPRRQRALLCAAATATRHVPLPARPVPAHSTPPFVPLHLRLSGCGESKSCQEPADGSSTAHGACCPPLLRRLRWPGGCRRPRLLAGAQIQVLQRQNLNRTKLKGGTLP